MNLIKNKCPTKPKYCDLTFLLFFYFFFLTNFPQKIFFSLPWTFLVAAAQVVNFGYFFLKKKAHHSFYLYGLEVNTITNSTSHPWDFRVRQLLNLINFKFYSKTLIFIMDASFLISFIMFFKFLYSVWINAFSNNQHIK